MVKKHVLAIIRKNELPHDGRLPSQRDLSKALNVSQKVAELALSELEKERIIVRKVGLGSFLHDGVEPATLVRKSDIIMVAVPTLKNPIFSSFVEDVEIAFRQHGRRVLVASCRSIASNQGGYLKVLKEEGSGGIIGIFAPQFLLDFAERSGIPSINVTTSKGAAAGNSIVIDLERAGELVADRILEIGGRPVVCAGCFPFKDRRNLDQRFKILERILLEKGIKVKIIPQETDSDAFDHEYEEVGRALAERIIASTPPPACIVFYNDARAMGAMKVFQEKGLSIPSDYELIGFDNIFTSAFVNPSLTTVDCGYVEAAKFAVQMILENTKGREIVLAPKLVERKSLTSKK